MGMLKNIKQAYDGKYARAEIKFFQDSFQVWKISDNTGKTYMDGSYPLKTKILITNSVNKLAELKDTNGNFYYSFPYDFNLLNLVSYLSEQH